MLHFWHKFLWCRYTLQNSLKNCRHKKILDGCRNSLKCNNLFSYHKSKLFLALSLRIYLSTTTITINHKKVSIIKVGSSNSLHNATMSNKISFKIGALHKLAFTDFWPFLTPLSPWLAALLSNIYQIYLVTLTFHEPLPK